MFRKKSPDMVSLGDIALDLVACIRRYPRSGGDFEIPAIEKHPGGSAANLAVAIARLGISSGFIGKVGSDESGKFLRDDLKREGVDVSHLRRETGDTGTVIVLVGKNGQRTMMSYRGVNVRLTPEEIPRAYIENSVLLHVSGYSLVHAPQCNAALMAMKYAKEANVKVSLDPSPHIHLAKSGVIAEALRFADVLLPNETEAKYLSRETNLRDAGRSLLRKRASVVTVKLGPRGCLVMTKNEELRVPAFNVKTVDTTGAGDSYDAGFLVGYLKGWDLTRSAEFANAAAALKTTKTGARIGLPHIDEVEKFIRNEHK